MRAVMLAFACRMEYHSLRAAAAAGYEVHVLGRDCARGLKYSRYCSTYRNFDFDPLSQSLDEALAEISRRVKELSADIILPSDIVSTRLLAALADRLPVKSCALPDPECFDMFNDKWRFYQFCRDHDVRVPQTWLFGDTGELKAAALEGAVPFPFIVKPHNSMGGSGIYRIMSKADLKLLDTIKYKPLLVQKLIIGDEVDISIVSNKGHVGVYAIQRNLPDKYVFIHHDALLAQASRALEASRFHGITHFDAIVEKTTGDVYLIECNPRVWYSIFASTIAGLNFVKMNIEVESLNPGKPQYLADKEVPTKKSTLSLIKQLITKFGLGETEYNLLKYNLADSTGRRRCWEPMFDDASLAPTSAGSIEHQVAALAAIRAMSPAEIGKERKVA